MILRNRRAFTLLELIVSIAVAGIIALLAYGSASAGFDTRDALARYRATSEAELRGRVLLADALRHASDDADPGHAAFELMDAMEPSGLPADQLTFLTRGVIPPLGGSGLRTMTLLPSTKGLVIRATPTSASGDAPVTAFLPGIRGLDVQVMSLIETSWNGVWATTTQIPAAVRLTFYDSSGSLVGAPLVVRLGLESIP